MVTEQVAPAERRIGPVDAVRATARQQPAGGVRSVFHSMSAKLLVVLLNAGTGILTARALHPQGRGELAAILLWPQLLAGTLTLGLPSAVTYHLRLQPRRTAGFLWSAWSWDRC